MAETPERITKKKIYPTKHVTCSKFPVFS